MYWTVVILMETVFHNCIYHDSFYKQQNIFTTNAVYSQNIGILANFFFLEIMFFHLLYFCTYNIMH